MSAIRRKFLQNCNFFRFFLENVINGCYIFSNMRKTDLGMVSKLPTGKYVGEWVVVCDSKIVAHSKNLKAIEKDILNCKSTPLIMKVPKQQVLLY